MQEVPTIDGIPLETITLLKLWLGCELDWEKHKLENQSVETVDLGVYFPPFKRGQSLRAYRKLFGVTGPELLDSLQR